MKPLKPGPQFTPGTVHDPAFRYRPSFDTSVARTFARLQRQQQPARTAAAAPQRDLFTSRVTA